MHRSGTSALTGLLQKLGAELGEELLPATRDNPKGYFENAEVVLTHEAVLTALGRGWQDPRALPDAWRDTAAADDAHATLTRLLDAMLASANLVAVKDPRASRLVLLWNDVSRAARVKLGAALMVRHPDEVAGSLRTRDGLSRARAHLLWMVYLLEAERGTRDVKRAFVSYESLLADWRSTLGRMRDAGLAHIVPEPTPEVASEIDVFLDASLRRHKASEESRGSSPFEALALELYGAALRASADVSSVEQQFDDVARRLIPLAARYLEAPLQLEQELDRQRLEQAQASATLQLAALRELWRPPFLGPSPGPARLYYGGENVGFTEVCAVSGQPQVSGLRSVVTFEVPADECVDAFRFDPDSAPGVYAIESVVINGERVQSLVDRIQGVNEHRVPNTREGDVVRFAALGEDPHFVFDARGLAGVEAGGILRVEVRFRCETVMSEVGGYLDEYRTSLTAHGRDLETWQAEIGDGVRALREQRIRIDGVADAVPGLADQQHQLGANLEALAGTVASVGASHLGELEASRAQLSGIVSELVEIRGQQAMIIEWMRRRSPRYWWSRLKAAMLR